MCAVYICVYMYAVIGQMCNPSTEEVEAGGLLHSKFCYSLSYILKFDLKQT